MRWLLTLIGLVAVICGGAYLVLKRDNIPYETLASRYESAASRYVDLPGGVHMHYRDEGQGPTLLLIHGFSSSLQSWEPWVQRLATGDQRINDYRVITLDLPGHGLTRAPAGYQASMENYRDLVAAFAESQHLDSFALAGNSMGGHVAWEYALAHPEQVNALILVDAAGWEPATANETEPMIFKLLRNPVLGPVLRDLDNTTLTRQGLQAAFADPALADDAMVTRYTEMSRAPGHREILVDLASGRAGRHFATAERLAALHMPVFILWGAEDHLIPASDAQRFHDAIPGSQVLVMEHVGHLPQEEAADASAMAVHEFLYQQIEGSALAAE